MSATRPPASRVTAVRVCGASGALAVATVRSVGPFAGRWREVGVHDGWDVHLSVELDQWHRNPWAHHSDVLTATRPASPLDAPRLVDRLLDRFVGCLVVCVPLSGRRGCLLGLRDGDRIIARPPAGTALRRPLRADLASLLHGWLAAGHRASTLRAAVMLTRQDAGGDAEGDAAGEGDALPVSLTSV